MAAQFPLDDLNAVADLAWQVYKSLKAAPDSFEKVHLEVLSLNAVLKEAIETVPQSSIQLQQRDRLQKILDGCTGVLKDLQALVDKYESMGANSRMSWDRWRWGQQSATELRTKLVSYTKMLTEFLSYLQVFVEQKLLRYLEEVQQGRREGSVASTATLDDLSQEDPAVWSSIRRELEEVGIIGAIFDTNREFIADWLKRTIESGAFQEQEQEADEENGESPVILEDKTIPITIISNSDVSPWLDKFPPLSSPDAILNKPPDLTKASPPDPPLPESKPLTNGTKRPKSSGNTNTASKKKAMSTLLSKLKANLAMVPEDVLLQAAMQGEVTWLLRVLNPELKSQRPTPAAKDWALLNACFHKPKTSTVMALLQHGADPNSTVTKGAHLHPVPYKVLKYDLTGCSAVMISALRGSEEVTRLLLDRRADPRHTLPHLCPSEVPGRGLLPTLLGFAVYSCKLSLVRLVLSTGASVNESIDSVSALHEAARQGSRALVEELLDVGADLEACSFDGTPLMVALRANHHDIVRLLLARGADVNATLNIATSDGHFTPVQVAMSKTKAKKKALSKAYLTQQVELLDTMVAYGARMQFQQYRTLEGWRKKVLPQLELRQKMSLPDMDRDRTRPSEEESVVRQVKNLSVIW